jgi:hypothetical protein
MDKRIYDTCMAYRDGKLKDSTWSSLATELGYRSAEALRSAFKRERKKEKFTVDQKIEYTKDFPRVVCFDVEMSPMIVYTFDLWNDGISPDNIIHGKHMLAWSGKQICDSKMHSDVMTSYESYRSDDERIVKSLWDFLNGAKILIGHNVKDYDMREVNTRFLMHGLNPISNYQVVDTLKVAKSVFAFESNKLKYINQKLDIKQKIDNGGMSLWIKCMEGDEASLKKMKEYCEGDTLSVEELYFKMRPYIIGHPNLGLMINSENPVCPNCASDDIIANGSYFTTAGEYESVRCRNCGALSRRRSDITGKEKKKNLLRN